MNAIDLKGQKAVVTGAARGIGYAIAERFVASGAAVAIWDIDERAARGALERLSRKGDGLALKVDVTDEGSIKNAVEATTKRLGQVDILVNNAGIAGSNVKTWEYSSAEWRRIVEIDLI
ncbi:MAG TPA: SDR family NAD(P)-dependent oxidoreductase, partial [Alphaproteobacteria bacterium]